MRNFSAIPSRNGPRPRMRIYGADLIVEGFPSGENQEGRVWGWNPNTGRPELRHPKIFFGPMALDASTGNISLTTNTWVPLYGAVDADGFRPGMVAYVPRGRYGLFGKVAIATTSTGKTYYVRVRQGTTEDDPVNQAKIAIGNPVTVGGGIGISPAVASAPFSIPFLAPDIQYAGDPFHADEIWVEVYAENTGSAPGAGAAISTSGQAAQATISSGVLIRWDGQHGTS